MAMGTSMRHYKNCNYPAIDEGIWMWQGRKLKKQFSQTTFGLKWSVRLVSAYTQTCYIHTLFWDYCAWKTVKIWGSWCWEGDLKHHCLRSPQSLHISSGGHQRLPVEDICNIRIHGKQPQNGRWGRTFSAILAFERWRQEEHWFETRLDDTKPHLKERLEQSKTSKDVWTTN